MNYRLQIPFVGAVVNSALYLSSVVGAGLLTGNGFAWRCGIAAMGTTYLSYLAQAPTLRFHNEYDSTPAIHLRVPASVRTALLLASIGLGAAAGLCLVVL